MVVRRHSSTLAAPLARLVFAIGLLLLAFGDGPVAHAQSTATRPVIVKRVPTAWTVQATGGIGVDRDGLIYVATSGQIYRFGPGASDVTTIAGQSQSLPTVRGMFVTPAGLVLWTGGNHTVNRVTPAGTATVVAGANFQSGHVDGPAAIARFNNPAGIVADAAGNLYVADSNNHVIRRIALDGTVSTLAGRAGQAASLDGTGDTARFNFPQRLAIDAAGNLYVAEQSRYSIRRITPAGVVTTLAGNSAQSGSADGVGAAARFNSIAGLAVDASDAVWVFDAGRTLRRVTADGTVTTVAGAPNQSSEDRDGAGTSVRFTSPQAITAAPDGTLLLGDSWYVRRATPDGIPVAPVIATQPVSISAALGGSVTLAVEAYGTPAPSYSWRKNGNVVTGAVGPALTLSNLTSGDAADYTVVVTNNQGSVTSAVATLTLVPAPVNDAFAARTTLTGAPVSAIAGFVGATREAGEPAHNGAGASGGGSLWWSWTAPATGFVTLDATHPNWVAKVYTGTAVDALTPVEAAGAYSGSNSASRFTFAATAGMTYQIALERAIGATANDGRFTLAYALTVQPFVGDSSSVNANGSDDGTGAAARFSGANGIVRDSSGNYFVADSFNHTIRKITPAGVVTTFAGAAGQSGTATGTGSAARFNQPQGLAIDAANNLYVADSQNHAIRKITPAGVVSNFAGLPGSSGMTNASGTSARFNFPRSVAVDASGNVYVADTNNFIIRRITSAGAVSTFAGTSGSADSVDGTGTAAKFYVPQALTLRGTTLYVGEGTTVARLRVVNTANAVVTTLNYSPSFGVTPVGMATDSTGHVYFTSDYNLTRVSPDGVATRVAGAGFTQSYVDGDAYQSRFQSSFGVLVEPDGSLLFTANNTVRRATITTQAAAPIIFTQPASRAVAAGASVTLSVAAFGGPNVNFQWHKNGQPIAGGTSGSLTFSPAAVEDSGTYTVTASNAAGSVTSDAVELTVVDVPANDNFASAAALTGAAVNAVGYNFGASRETGEPVLHGLAAGRSVWWQWTAPHDGMVVADTAGSALPLTYIAAFTGPNVASLTQLGTTGFASGNGDAARVYVPVSAGVTYHFAIDASANNNAVSEGLVRLNINYAHTVVTIAGAAGQSGVADETGPVARFSGPVAMTRDADGNLYVGESAGRVVRKITPAGVVTTLAGTAFTSGTADGTGAAARFTTLAGMTRDADGNLYVTDSGAHTIRKITPAGVVTTLAGLAAADGGGSGAVDGTGSAARFNSPRGIAYGSDGALYVADLGNRTIRRVTLAGEVTTFAGAAGQSGTIDGTGDSARLSSPIGLTTAPDGNLYVADNTTVRRVTVPGAAVTTIAGAFGGQTRIDDFGTAARFGSISTLGADATGNLYIGDPTFRFLRKLSPNGHVSTIAGSGSTGANSGSGPAASFSSLQGFTVAADGTVFFADQSQHIIRRAAPSYLPQAPLITATPASQTVLAGQAVTLTVDVSAAPTAQAVWRRNGSVIAGATGYSLVLANAQPADSGNYQVEFTNASGTATTNIFTLTVLPAASNDNFVNRAPLAGTQASVVANNFLATVETGEPAHYEGGAGRSVWWTWTAPHDGQVIVDTYVSEITTLLSVYTGNAVNALTRVADGTNFVRFQARAGTTYQLAVDGRAAAMGGFTLNLAYAYGARTVSTPPANPRQFARAANGTVYFTDAGATVRRLEANGDTTIIAGAANQFGSDDGVGGAARFVSLEGIAVAADGTLYVADNNTIRRIAPDGTVTRIAGSPGLSGTANGPGLDARFNVPAGLALDAAGQYLYIADFQNYAIRRLELATNTVTTFAGAIGTRATAAVHNGTGTAARFYNPIALTFDPAGNLYVADQGIALIRKITPGAVVTTLTGTALSTGTADGPVGTARLQNPTSIACDPAGHLVVTDNHALRTVTLTGTVLTVTGSMLESGNRDGVGDMARFAFARGLALAPDGTGWFGSSNRIVRLETPGAVFAPFITTHPSATSGFVGSTLTLGVAAVGTPADFTYQWFRDNEPISGATSATLALNNLQLTDAGTYRVEVSNAGGTASSSSAVVTVIARPANDSFANAIVLTGSAPGSTVSNLGATREAGEPQHANNPGGASLWWKWVAPASGAVIADAAGSSIDPIIAVYSGDSLANLVEQGSAAPTPPVQYAPPPRPPAVMFTAVEGTTYWIAMDGDFGVTGDLVLHLSFTYNFTTLAGLAGTSGNVNGTGTAARFNRLNATVPDAQGNIYVADLNNHAIRKVTPAGVVTTVAGPTGSSGVSGYVNSTTASSVRFNSPAGIVLAADGFLYVADAGNHTIRKVNPNNGTTTTFAGPTTATLGTADGTTTAARFNNPAAIVLDSAGNFIVADATNHAIRKITSAGVVTTVAGLKGTSGAVNANGTNARFNTPEGVAVDAAGNIYVADFRNHAVRKIALNGDVTTVAGQLSVDPNVSTSGYIDGLVANSKLSGPNGVTALADGSVLIADYYNSALRIITTDGYVLTLAGGNGGGHADGTGLGIKFNQPATISVDNQGRIYIADQSNHVVRRGIITSAPSAPDISKQPQGIRIIAGSTVTLTAGAIGNPFPTYQWRKNGVAIDGATSGTLTLANAQPSDSGSYTLVATNIHGTATTEAAVVEILPLAANDSFATRARLVGDAIGISAYNYLATAQPGEPAHGGGAGAPAANSVWFTWTAPTTGDVTIDTIGALFDTRLSIYRGETLATLQPWISSTAEPGKKFAKVRLAVNAGDVFQIAVDGVNGAQGDFRLTIDYSWNFALYAGAVNTSGNGGTTLAAARFNFPAAMARDNAGNLYIADTENHTIRKITAAGVVSVFAGSPGLSGTATGTGTAARFNRPYGVAVDAAGNVYVADTNNHAIRKITPAGAVSNFAGLPGTSGSNDGTGTAARFNNPANVALDSAGNVYVTDYSNALIRKITPAGVVTTFAGVLNTFGNDPKYFNVPWGIAVDSAGNVYVGDRADIRKITPAGVASYFAGNVNSSDGSADGLGTAAEFNYPAQLSIDAAGNLYVADRMNSLIRKISPNGEVRTIGGRPQVHGYLDGTADVAVFGYPMGLFVDAGGFMYVGDSGSYLVRLGSRQAGPRAPAIVTQPIDQAVPSGGTVSFSVVASGYPAPTYQWRRNGTNIVGATSPVLTLTNVTQIGSYDVVVTNTHGTVTSRAAGLLLASAPQNDSFANALPLTGPGASGSGSPSLATAEANEPAHAGATAARSLWWSWMAPAHGMVVAQTAGSAQDTRLAVYTGTSVNALTLVGENDDELAGGTSRVQFMATAGTTYYLAVDVNEAFATNFGGVRVGVDYAYVSSTFAGSAGNAGTVNGTGAAARFANPSGIARDSFGNLYVSEAEQHVIRKVTPEGVVSVFAGAPGQFGAVNGNGAAARFNLPYGLAVDANNNVFVADYGNRVIRRITPNGDVTTFAGAFGQGGATDGAAGTARFNLVFGLAFDANGVLYVTDLGNHNVRKISAGNVTTLAGSTSGVTGALDGTTTAARFNQPRGLAVDSQGSVYVADFGNHTVRKITAAGVVTTLAGFAGSIGAADGVGSNARFAGPFAVAIDAQERLYVTDANHRVRVVSPVDGLVTTAAGSTEGAAEGIALAAQFDVPFAIIAAPNGVLYIADYDNHTVRALTPSSQVAVAQSIGFAPLLDRAYTPNPITLNATTTSGLPVIFELVEGDASLDGNQLTLLGTGVVTIRATQPGNATTLPAEPVTRSFTVTPNFLSWQLERFTPEELANATLTGPNADYDRDGVSNLVEYALGRDPKVAGAAPFAEVAASAGEWTFVYSRPADRTDVSYTVEISTNLTTWTTANVTHERIGTGPTETWRARAPLSTGANLFFRLRVER